MGRALIIVRGDGDRRKAAGWCAKAPPHTRIDLGGDVASLTLTRGYVAVVDAADVPLVNGGKWTALVSPKRHAVYACRSVAGKMLLLHRLILAAPPGVEVDHIDGDGLNNRRANLRLCSHADNQKNKGPRSGSRSGLKGVSWDSRAGRWRAEIAANGRRRWLGLFDDPAEAASAYEVAAKELHGEFARIAP